MTRLLESPDAWLAQNASPSILVARWNQLAVEVRKNGTGLSALDNFLARGVDAG